MKLRHHNQKRSALRAQEAFTLVEIALCIAIVAFALVAIIGVLPTGLEVQKENREETVINQDAQVWADTIRNATTNAAVLTNNIEWIEFRTITIAGTTTTNFLGRLYATNLASRQILGAICTPKYLYSASQTNINRTVIKCRSISRPLAMEATNIQDLTFSYLLTAEVVPLNGHMSPFGSPTATTTNLWDLRMTFEWPVLRDATNNSTVGNGRRVIRSMVAARLFQEDQANASGVVTNTAWFFQPGTFSPF